MPSILLSNPVHLLFRVEKREAEAAKPWPDDVRVGLELLEDPGGIAVVHPQEYEAVGAGASAPGPGLHAEQVVQERTHEVVVEVPATAWRTRRKRHGGGEALAPKHMYTHASRRLKRAKSACH